MWTRRAVEYHHDAVHRRASRSATAWLSLASAVTEMNAAVFDPANRFRGCLAGIGEVLRRQGLVRSAATLEPDGGLSAGQAAAIDRVVRAFPELIDDDFIAANRDAWLA